MRNSLLCEAIHAFENFSFIRSEEIFFLSRTFVESRERHEAHVRKLREVHLETVEWKSESFHEALGKNPVPSSSHDLITVTGGRREKSFSLSFRGLGEKRWKINFFNYSQKIRKHFPSELPKKLFRVDFKLKFEVAFSERENFRYFFSRYNMMSFSGLCSKS
jgi:hypothetical protein